VCFVLLHTINNMAPFKVVHVYQYNKFISSQIHSVDHTFQSITDKMKANLFLNKHKPCYSNVNYKLIGFLIA